MQVEVSEVSLSAGVLQEESLMGDDATRCAIQL